MSMEVSQIYNTMETAHFKNCDSQYWRLPTPVFWPREFHGLYSPWGHKELETTE